MVDKNILMKRIEEIGKHFDKINPYNTVTYDSFKNNSDIQDIVEYNLFQIINHIIDMIQHIAVDEDYGHPQTAYEAAQILCENNILLKKDLKIIKEMIGFRNVIGHDYIGIDKKTVYELLKHSKEDINMIISQISKKFL